MNSAGKIETVKTVELSSGVGGGSIDVSKLCAKPGVSCKVSGNSCNGSIDIKIIDSNSIPALSAQEIAWICYGYARPREVLPLKISCSFGKDEDSQTSVFSGTFAKIEFTPRVSQ